MNLLIYIMFALCYDESIHENDYICALKRQDSDLQKCPALPPLMQWKLI